MVLQYIVIYHVYNPALCTIYKYNTYISFYNKVKTHLPVDPNPPLPRTVSDSLSVML